VLAAVVRTTGRCGIAGVWMRVAYGERIRKRER
jgi:hypothetical protein